MIAECFTLVFLQIRIDTRMQIWELKIPTIFHDGSHTKHIDCSRRRLCVEQGQKAWHLRSSNFVMF